MVAKRKNIIQHRYKIEVFCRKIENTANTAISKITSSLHAGRKVTIDCLIDILEGILA